MKFRRLYNFPVLFRTRANIICPRRLRDYWNVLQTFERSEKINERWWYNDRVWNNADSESILNDDLWQRSLTTILSLYCLFWTVECRNRILKSSIIIKSTSYLVNELLLYIHIFLYIHCQYHNTVSLTIQSARPNAHKGHEKFIPWKSKKNKTWSS